jgi:hypothetical protein
MARARTKYFDDVPCEYCGTMLKPQLRFRKGKFNGVWRAQRFCSTACANRARPAKIKVDKAGYIYTYRPGSTRGERVQIYEHRVVMEGIIGRELTAEETVHHKNGNRTDNRPENLELWASRHPRGQRIEDILPALSHVASSHIEGFLSLGA